MKGITVSFCGTLYVLILILSTTPTTGQDVKSCQTGAQTNSLKTILETKRDLDFKEIEIIKLRAASSKVPMNLGLPARLNFFLPENEGYLSYVGFRPEEELTPPIASKQISITPELPESSVFHHQLWIKLPENQTIEKRKIVYKENEKEIWSREKYEFPAGTKLLDSIHLADSDKTLYEMRLALKRDDGTWAFGVYIPDEDKKILSRFDGPPTPVSFQFKTEYNVKLMRINPRDCASCHDSQEAVGHPEPYGFAPTRHSNLLPWAKQFESLHGYNPFR